MCYGKYSLKCKWNRSCWYWTQGSFLNTYPFTGEELPASLTKSNLPTTTTKSPNLANTMEMMPFSSPWTKSNIQQTLYIQTYSFTDMFLKCQISILDLKAKKQAWVAGTHWARLLDLSTCPSPQGCMIFPEAYQLSQMSSTTAVNKTPVPFRVGQLAKEWTFYHILLEFPFCASFSVVESVICVRARSVKANKENLTTTTKKRIKGDYK